MVKYGLRLDEDRLPMLVRETAFRHKNGNNISRTPADVVQMLAEKEDIYKRTEEHCYLIAVDTKCKTLGYFELSVGGADSSIVDAKGVFSRLLAVGATGFVLVHNHPSGDCAPSSADLAVNQTLKDGATILQIRFLDSIICGNGNYYSAHEQGIL